MHQVSDKMAERNPEFDPRRDGLPEYESVDAFLTGSPPIGRSALDKMRSPVA